MTGSSGIKLRRIFEYGISPFAQRTFGPDYWATWRAFFNASRIILRKWTIPVGIFGTLVWWGNSFHYRLHRKDPYVYWIEDLENFIEQNGKTNGK